MSKIHLDFIRLINNLEKRPLRTPCTHFLKIIKEYYEKIITGEKTFEIRNNDRKFLVGDRLQLDEWHQNDPIPYSGRSCIVEVAYITDWNQRGDYVVMGIKLIGSDDTDEDS